MPVDWKKWLEQYEGGNIPDVLGDIVISIERVKEQDSNLLQEIEDSFGDFFKDISIQLKEKL